MVLHKHKELHMVEYGNNTPRRGQRLGSHAQRGFHIAVMNFPSVEMSNKG